MKELGPLKHCGEVSHRGEPLSKCRHKYSSTCLRKKYTFTEVGHREFGVTHYSSLR